MLLTELKRFVLWIAHRHEVPRARVESVPTPPNSALELDPAWHGDHWQNLLASPMDARHYVMEDWTTAVTPAFDSHANASGGVRRANRRVH